MLLLENLTKEYKGKRILNNINYFFKFGNIYTLSGENGCGKTTLLKLMTTLMKPTHGSIKINTNGKISDFSIKHKIGAMIENPIFFDDLTGFQNLKMLSDIPKIDKKKIIDLMQYIGLENVCNVKYKKYSLGMKQKLGIVCALMDDPNIILMDEPTNALDSQSIDKFISLIQNLKKNNKLIIITTHKNDRLIQIADFNLKLKDGSIFE